MQTASAQSPLRIMIVDDSSVMRGLMTRVLEAEGMQIVASCHSGLAALNLLKRETPKTEVDAIILESDMRGADGQPIIKDLRSHAPDASIIVACTLNESSVVGSIDALDLGASEMIAKPSSRKNQEETHAFVAELVSKINRTSKRARANLAPAERPAPVNKDIIMPPKTDDDSYTLRKAPSFFRPKVLAIASSTGGPKALQEFFTALGTRAKHLPIFLTQHMPKDFTSSLAEQLQRYSGLPCTEGGEGQKVEAGHIYVAPGERHMLIETVNGLPQIKLTMDPPENYCRPAADPMLRSLLETYGKEILVVIFTGMGQDGMLGAKMIADQGGIVVAQDKETSVVWGMPGAAAKEGVCHFVLPLPKMADAVAKICSGVMP